MEAIKKQITDDNVANNVSPRGSISTQSSPRSPRHDHNGERPPLRMPSPTDYQRNGSSGQDGPRRQSPQGQSTAEDMLAQRFARLRAVPELQTKSASSQSAPTSTETLDKNAASSVRPRPQGPRPMGTSAPAAPPKIPLEPTSVSMPRPPSPAYSLGWTAPSQSPFVPPPPVLPENARPNGRYSQLTSSRSSSLSRYSDDDNPYRSRTPNGFHARDHQSRSANLPHNPAIEAPKLLEYMRQHNVLVIDVRPREQFDSGHIYAKSIICIEPVALKENMSAEELEERLVVSPEHEQSLFERRNEFDLVVYYDQNTASVSYLAGSPVGTSAPHLRALYDTLYEFNEYKPLKDGRPPALLLGGLDAWVDLVGPQSLATSSTAAVMGSIQAKQPMRSRRGTIGRVPMASANSSLEIRKRRLREFTPLNSEELTAWMERTKNEEVESGAYDSADGSIAEEPEGIEDRRPSFVHSYEDFLRRYPEPHAIQQSMVASAPVSMPDPTDFAVPVAPSRPPPAVPRPTYSGVSEGRQVQPTLARQNSATRQALYTPSSIASRMKLPRTGLRNFGVTCYMNATIQCLSATVIMSKFFIDNRFRYYLQKNWKGSQGVMPGLYANLIRSLWKNDVEVIVPTSFRNFCGRLNREWAIDRQQDAKEFFDFLVDCLHEDLNINWQRTPLRPLTFEEEMQRERMPVPKVSKIEWDRYSHREESFISSLFAGQHASRLRCTTCQRTSTTFEAFYSISVEIPTSGSADIYQCLQSYCKEEMLSGDEVWKCPYCKKERVATKQIILTRAPQILVVHFKRFSASKTQSARKIHTPIDFPLHGLRMDRFMISHGPPANGETTNSGAPLSPTTGPFIYDAYAVLRHMGSTLSGGHYISLVRDAYRGCWRRFDDERVMDFDPRELRHADRLQNEQAYIVFYERVPAR